MKTLEKLELLQKCMKRKGLHAYIVPSSDPHLSEYLPEHWKGREWLSGFTGSSGTLVVTRKGAALWTDSRYFVQAEHELADTGIDLWKTGVPDTVTIETWVAENVKHGGRVGFNGRLFSVLSAKNMISELTRCGLKCSATVELFENIWDKRPQLPAAMAFEQPLRYTGKSVSEKLAEIRTQLASKGADYYPMCTLDDVCWTFNIRGSDVPFNPVVLAYALIGIEKACLFIDASKIDEPLANTLNEQGVSIKPYSSFYKQISRLGRGKTVLIDSNRVNYRLFKTIPSQVRIQESTSITSSLKAVKNSVELEGFRQAMVDDGVAMVKLLFWLERNVGSGKISEVEIASRLLQFRMEGRGFVSESFATIAAYADHGAMVHYHATKETEYNLQPDGFLLVDSGGQYLSGTTDITRTVHLGNPTEEEKLDYTLVLKGMIKVANAKFPVGTRGSQLDTLARASMWQHSINYGHGTGHGVGSFLNVHEGPQQLRPESQVPIEPGMVVSNEPGIYRTGKHGIRIENLITCVHSSETEFGKFLRFETLTLCPIDTKPIISDMLLPDEVQWLNSYHKTVFDKLSGRLTKELQEWLKCKTQEI